MRSLRKLLSVPSAVLLRLSPCNTKSAHPPISFEHSSHSQFSDHPPDTQSHLNQDKVLPTPRMPSSRSHRITSSSYLQSCFDLTLTEYSKETGIDLIKHPIVATLDQCDCVDTVIAAILGQIRSNDSKIDRSMVELMRQLKSTVQIVFWLSPTDALSDNIDLVGRRLPGSCILYGHAVTHALQRFTPAKAIFASIGVLLAVCCLLHSGGSL